MKRAQDTGRIQLQLARKQRFEPSSAEVFHIEAADVGSLKQVELGHDGVGRDCNWLVKSIEVKEVMSGIIYNISCNAWLSTSQKDGLTVRKFNVDAASTHIVNSEGMLPFQLSIQTGDVPKAGTDSSVTLKVFGAKGGSSRDVVVEKLDDRFERASVVDLPIELEEDLGSLRKVRVSLSGKGGRKEWFLKQIELTNLVSGKRYLFVCEDWVRGSVDLALVRAGQETIARTDYKVSVRTSDLSGAGTDANVFVTLFGQNGDSGELELRKSETNMNKFERGRLDVFVFKGVLSLGELVKMRVRHDNTGSLIGNANWHLAEVRVEESGREWVFRCGKWLSLSKEDKQIVRELKPEGGDGSAGAGKFANCNLELRE